MKRILFRNQKGAVFLTTMVTTFLMVMIGSYMYQMTTQDVHYINRVKKSNQALFLAEAGLGKALSTLNNGWSARSNAGSFTLTTLDPGTYQAQVTQTGGRVLVTSTGTAQGMARQASAEVKAPVNSVLHYALAGNKISFVLDGHTSVVSTGKIYADTTILLYARAGTSVINLSSPGIVDAGGAITVAGAGTKNTGAVNPNTSLAGHPVLDFNYYKTIAQSTGGYIAGDVTYNTASSLPSPAGKVIFVEGNITVSANQTTDCAIFATGNITFSNGGHTSATINVDPPDNYPALVTQYGSITVMNVGMAHEVVLNVTGFVYSGNNFNIQGNHRQVNITDGSIIATGSITGDGAGAAQNILNITYQRPNIIGLISSGAVSMRILSYNT